MRHCATSRKVEGSVLPIPVVALWACGRNLAGIADSNLAEGMGVCVLYSEDKGTSQDKTKKQIRKKYKERTREGNQGGKSPDGV